MKFLTIQLLFIVLLMSGSFFSLGQSDQVMGDFEAFNVLVTTTPNNPGICQTSIGTQISCDQDFLSYEWKFLEQNNSPTLSGKTITVDRIGQWRLTVSYVKNGVTCYKTIEFEVYDISSASNIRDYLEATGFYSLYIKRPNISEDECTIEDVSLKSSLNEFYSLQTGFEKIINEFEPVKDLGGDYVLSNNSCFCQSGVSQIESLESKYDGQNIGIWGHTFYETDSDFEGSLYIKAQLSNDKELPNLEQKAYFATEFPTILDHHDDNESLSYALVSNILMPYSLGGHNLQTPCLYEFNDQDLFVAPTGGLLYNKSYNDLLFTDQTSEPLTFSGALRAFKHDDKSYLGYRDSNNDFLGYFNSLTGDIINDFMYPVSSETFFSINLPFIDNALCRVFSPNLDSETALLDEDGGIGKPILTNLGNIYETPEGSYLPQPFENSDNETVSFVSPTGKVVTLNHDDLTYLNFAYGAYTVDGQFNPNIATGVLLGFKLEDENEEEDYYVFDQDALAYVSVLTGDTYVDPYSIDVADGVIFQLACGDKFTIYKVDKSSLEKHVNGQGPLLYGKFFDFIDQFKPFSSSFSYLEGPHLANNSYNCIHCPGDMSLRITGQYCRLNEHIIVDKIAQVAALFESYFAEFTQLKNWEAPIDFDEIVEGSSNKKEYVHHYATDWYWGNYLDEHPDVKALFGQNNYEYFIVFLEEFLKFIDNKGKFWDLLNPNTPKNTVISHLESEPQLVTKNLPSFAKKMLALDRLFSDGDMHEFAENAVIHILSTTFEDSEATLDYLENLNIPGSAKQGLSFIWDNFHNILGQDNLTRVYSVISAHIGQVDPVIDYTSTTTGERYIDFLLDNPNLIPKLEGDIFQWDNANAFYVSPNEIKINDLETLPYDHIVPVQVTGSFFVNNSEYKKGTLLMIPAAQAHLFSHVTDMIIAEKAGWVALDLGLMAIGIGAAKILVSTGNWVRKGIVASDIIGSIAGMSTNLINSDAISNEMKIRIQLASFIASTPMLISSLPKVGKAVDDLDAVLRASSPPPAVIKAGKNVSDDITKGIIRKEGKINEDFSDEMLAIDDGVSCGIMCKLGKYGCFTSSTKVATEEGYSAINAIKPGQKVWSYNHDSSKKELKPVSYQKRYMVSAIIGLVMCTADTVWTTANHPFFYQGAYVEAEVLDIGTELETKEGTITICDKLIVEKNTEVFNLTIEDNNNFYVSDFDLLVHNDDCLAKKLDYPKYKNVLKKNLDELPDDLKGKLMQDMHKLEGSAQDAFLDVLNTQGGVKAWKVVDDIGTNAAWRRSPEFLQKVSNILEDANLRNVIKGSGSGTPEQELTKILTTLQANPCIVCNAASNNLTLRPIENILDDIANAANNLPNYSTANIVSQFKIFDPSKPGKYISKNRGWAFELRQVVRKNNPNAVHGGTIPNAQHGSHFDMKVGSKLDEFKSTESITGTLYNPSNTNNKINQLLDYFGGINKADDLAITFDAKALGTGVSAVDEMKTVIGNLKAQIFPRMNASLRNDIFNKTDVLIEDVSDIDLDVINYLTNTIVKID